MKKLNNKLVILDTMALIYRAHFAMISTPRITSYGLNTSAIYGFINSIFAMIDRESPTHIVAAIDSSHPTFRQEDLLDYKAHRNAQPEDITIAIPYVKKFLSLVGVPVFEVAGYEADDIIGTITKKLYLEDFDIYIMSPDKDFAQLLYSDNIFIYKPNANSSKEGNILNRNDILKIWDINEVSQVCDMLGLQGDASDNIPGVPGIGPKNASKLLKSYGTIENLLKNLHELKGSQKENLEKHASQAIISKKIATIFDDVPIDINYESFLWNKNLSQDLFNLLKELELKSLYTRLFPISNLQNDDPENHMGHLQQQKFFSRKLQSTFLETENDILRFVESLNEKEQISIFTEKNSITSDYIYIANSDMNVFFFNILLLKDNKVLNLIKELFENKKIRKIFLNSKDLFHIALIEDNNVENFEDLQILMGLVYGVYNASLENICKYVLQEEFHVEAKGLFLNDYHTQNCYSAICLYMSSDFIISLLHEKKLDHIYYNLELPLVNVLFRIEKNGVSIDGSHIVELAKYINENIKDISEEIFSISQEKFNIASPKQLGIVLFEKLKIAEKPKKTKSGQYSTDEEYLRQLLENHEIISKILEFRELQKLKTNYIDVLPTLVSKKDNLIHTTYNQASVVTGRLSSSNPNLQTIPTKTETGKKIRQLFIPRSSKNILLSADYSQIELRVIAAMANDENMKKAFLDKIDIHNATASKIFGVEIEDVTEQMRRIAKTANFGIIYGISPFGLSKRLNIPKSEAQNIINKYFDEFPSIHAYMNDTINLAKSNGFVSTIFGRRQYLADINSKNNVLRGHAERNAINMPIQGTAAEVVKIAMINLDAWLKINNENAKIILQVHDELLLEIPENELDNVAKNVKIIMETRIKELDVNFDVNIKVGKNWLEMDSLQF